MRDWINANPKTALGGVAAGGALAIGSLNPKDQMLNRVTTENTAEQPVAKEIATPPSEEEKELRKQLAAISGAIGGKSSNEPTIINFDGDSEVSKENLRQAQNRENILNFIANRADSNKYLAYDIAGIDRPGELVGGENIRNMAKNQISQYKDRVQMEEEDPNSPQSKGYRELAKSMGFEIRGNASAADLEKQLPQLANIYNQKEARLARAQDMKMQLASMQSRKAEAKDMKDRSFIQGLRKEATAGSLGKLFNNYTISKRMDSALQQFAANPTGYSDFGSLMGGLKVLQGDDSVVREAEMRLGMNAASLPNKIKNWASRLATGKSLQPEQRQDMINAVQILSQTAREQYMQAIEPLMFQAKQEGYDPKLILGEELTKPVAPRPTTSSSGPTGKSGLTPEQRQKRIQELRAKQGAR
jgi:hypothetical protein